MAHFTYSIFSVLMSEVLMSSVLMYPTPTGLKEAAVNLLMRDVGIKTNAHNNKNNHHYVKILVFKLNNRRLM